MSNRFKFRAWSDDLQMMSAPFSFGSVLRFDKDNGLGYVRSITNEAVMQFTGLKDRNGVEIYEGDIVESDFYYPDYMCIAEVSYCNVEARYKFNKGESEQDAFVYGNLYVKGNIHQNPELLEKQQ